jgi:hypothetical protein
MLVHRLLWGALVLACETRGSSRPVESIGDAARAGDASPVGCVSDSECPGGFCDRSGSCESVSDRRFGMACQWPPTLPSGLVDGRLFVTCGGYRCIDGRCRSCASDAECRDSGGMCRAAPEFFPGHSCTFGGLPGAKPPDFQPRIDPTLLGVRVERVHPHAPDAFTEGLVYQDGWLYESTGLEGSVTPRNNLGRVRPQRSAARALRSTVASSFW